MLEDVIRRWPVRGVGPSGTSKPWRCKGIPAIFFDELWRGALRKSWMDAGTARPIGVEGRSCGKGVMGLVLAMVVVLRQRLNCPWHCWCVDELIGR